MIYELASAEELMLELGKSVMLARAVRGLALDDLAKSCQSSPQEIERIESGHGGDLLTFLRISQALHFAGRLMETFKPRPASLDELERMEALLQAEHEQQARRRGEGPPGA